MNRELILRMFKWPLLWRVAVHYALKQQHTEDSGNCLPCRALLRTADERHLPTLNTLREVVCSKCALPRHAWAAKCKGSRPQNPALNERRTPYIPVFWE